MNATTQQPQIQTPPGYGKLTPLNRQAHAGLGLGSPSYAWARSLNSIYISAPEISRAALDYPIGFVRDNVNNEFFPVAVFGLRNGDNLFVDDRNQWLPHLYLPAYMRRFPFFVIDVQGAEPGPSGQQLICVDDTHLVKSSTPLFDASGDPTDQWTPHLQLIESFQSAQQTTRAFMRKLEALGLFVPCDAVAMPSGRPALRLQGLFRLDEAKLRALPDSELRQMLDRNELRAIFAHLLSLENFTKLMLMTVEADGRRDKTH
jgi:hypothetical protein